MLERRMPQTERIIDARLRMRVQLPSTASSNREVSCSGATLATWGAISAGVPACRCPAKTGWQGLLLLLWLIRRELSLVLVEVEGGVPQSPPNFDQ
jgi:hypothetical protein